MFGGLDLPESDAVARDLAASGTRVLTVDYSLTAPPVLSSVLLAIRREPGHHPRATEDVHAVVTSVMEDSGGPVFLGGASAGACLASMVARNLELQEHPVAGVIAAYGFFHRVLPPVPAELRAMLRGHRRFTHHPLVLGLVNANFEGPRGLQNRTLGRFRNRDADHSIGVVDSPFPGDTPVKTQVPQLFIDAAHDVMRASGARYARTIDRLGGTVEQHTIAGADHAFLNDTAGPAYAEAVNLISAWLRQQVVALTPDQQPCPASE